MGGGGSEEANDEEARGLVLLGASAASWVSWPWAGNFCLCCAGQ